MKAIPFMQEHLPQLQSIDMLLWLSLQYNGDVDPVNAFVVMDDTDTPIGAGYVAYDASWYAAPFIQVPRRLLYTVQTRAEHPLAPQARVLLTQALIDRAQVLAGAHPEWSVRLTAYCMDDDPADAQFFLEQGFAMVRPIPVLRYDLTGPLPEVALPDEVRIVQRAIDEDFVQAYHAADSLASDGQPGSVAELWFRSGAEGFTCYAAMAGEEVIGSISIWPITQERGATENIFVTPAFRRKGVARAMIAHGLAELAQRGHTYATLSVLGDNLRAIRLYLSCGYTLWCHLVEMQYIIPAQT